jgi:hypothetical protein
MKTTYDQVHYFIVVGLLHLLLIVLAWENYLEYHLKYMTSSILGVACYFWSTLLIASTKHLKCPSDHHFYVSLSSTTLGLPTKGSKPLQKGEVTFLQRTILDTHLK